MKKKFTIQNIYLFFLIVNLVMLITGAFTVKENLYDRGAAVSQTEIVPVRYEETDDGKRQYTLEPETDDMDSYLMFYTNHQEVWVYADDELIYSRERINTIFSHSVGSVWNIMEFPQDTGQLTIVMKAVYPSGSDHEYTFYQGNGVEMYAGSVRESLPAMAVSALITMLGICMIIYWFLICRKMQIAKELFYMGIFVVLLGLWAFSEEKGAILLLGNRPYVSYLAFTLLMLMGISFLLFVKHFLGAEDRYVHRILAIYSFGSMFVSILLQCLNIADYKQTALLTHIVLVCDLLYLLFIIWDKMRKRKNKRRVYLNLAGLLVLAVAVGVELFAYYTQLKGLQIFGTLGFLVYIIILGSEICASALDKLEEGRKAEIYKELAEKDMLTQCYNRNAYNEDIRKTFSAANIYLVMFDLNDLKKCNDTLGHMEGDRYLTDAAELIKKIFTSYGRIYRIGGDEFCIIMENTSEKQIENLIKQLVQEETAYNKQSKTVHMQIASGYARYDAQIDANLDHTRSRADALMYENKKALKAISAKSQEEI
ncbi:MAG: GGDEF domain-containing protein [Roseburia sp.]|nr:GGDEF domain-containing protein [Roseburia sp.]MCM1243822.1 GGDEF domain-containing protein [Roseburia sp.]